MPLIIGLYQTWLYATYYWFVLNVVVLRDFIPGRTRYESVNYGISNY